MGTILIQEPDEAIRDIVTTALQMEGYRVCSLTDTNENVLEMIRKHRPQLILLDCWLSDYSAGQVSQWIKAHFPHLPVVAFSCDHQIGEKYRQFGFDDYIKKPFDLELLYKVVKKHHLKRHQRRQLA
jgi:DNA-binding response OmpR family regulator